MILSLDLKKSYGQTNTDIAKKNKINQINISVKTLEESSDDSGSFSLPTQTLTSEDNTNKKIVSTDYKTLIWKSVWVSTSTSNFPSFIGNVLYKDYTVTIDLSDTQYSTLKTIKTAPECSVLFSGTRYKLSSNKNHVVISKVGTTEKQVDIDYSEIMYALTNNVDLVHGLDNLTTDGFWGETTWTETNSIVNNLYGENNENAYSEIISFVQDGANNTNTSFLSLSENIKPIIRTWENDENTIVATISIPSKVYLFGSETGYIYGSIPDMDLKLHSDLVYSDANMFKYEFTSASIILPDYKSSSETKTYYSGNRVYNANNSDLFTSNIHLKDTKYATIVHPDGTIEYRYDKYYNENFADEIYERYQNGKLMLDITYPVSEIKDISGLDVVFSSRYGLLTKIGERFFDTDGNEVVLSTDDKYSSHIQIPEGTLCNVLINGRQAYTNPDGSAKYFIVQTSDFSYSGILTNKLTLSETTIKDTNTFDRLSWAELDAIGEFGELGKYVSVGDRKYVTLSDANQSDNAKSIPLVVLGFNHDNLSSETGKSGMTIGMEGILSYGQHFDENEKTPTSWRNSDIRSSLSNDLSYLPTDLQKIIKSINKTSIQDSASKKIYSTTEDKLFLLSLTEILGSEYIKSDSTLNNHYGADEGSRYEYWYTVKNGQNAEDRKKYDYITYQTIDGERILSPQPWWTRSVSVGYSLPLDALIGSDGSITNYAVTNASGVSYAFCIGEKKYSDYKGSLENATWSDISILSVSGKAQQVFKIGDTKNITLIDGTQIELVIIGLYHDILSSDASKVGITFAMKDTNSNITSIINNTATNTGSWEQSYIRNTTIANLFDKLPDDLKSVIKTVNKLTSAGEKSSTIITTKDRLWIPSCVELTGNEEYVISGEGTQYEYYKNSIHLNTSDTKWTRSPYYNSDTSWVSVNYEGVVQPQQSATSEKAVILCFCV